MTTVAFLWLMPGATAADSASIGPAPTTADYYRVRDGYIAARDNRCDDVVALLRPAIQSPTFPGFPQRVRRGALEHAAECTLKISGWAEALPLIYQIIEIPDGENAKWMRRIVRAGAALHDPQVSVDGLLRLAALDPESVSRIRPHTLLYIDQSLKLQDEGDDLRYSFLRALHSAGYKPSNPFEYFDDLMLAYARMAADRGDTDGLREIVLSLTQPRLILEVRIDRRFDAIRQDGSLETFLDLEDAAEREIHRLGVLLEKYDKSALAYLEYAKALASVRRFEEALQVIEPIALRIRTPEGRNFFIDSEPYESWVLQEYSKALGRLTYREQSEDFFKEAVNPLDRSQTSVSQQINYASNLMYDGHFDESLEAIAGFDDSSATEFGRMWLRTIKVCANTLSQNPEGSHDSLSYLIANERANPRALLDAYLCMNDLDGAADVQIRRLYSTDQRISALLSMQIQTDPRRSEVVLHSSDHEHASDDSISTYHLLRHREEAVHRRRDVLDAVNTVGRIEHVPLLQSSWWRP